MEFLLKKSQEFGLDWIFVEFKGKPALYSKKHKCHLRESKKSWKKGEGLVYDIFVNNTKVVIPQDNLHNPGDYFRGLFATVATIAKTLHDLKA